MYVQLFVLFVLSYACCRLLFNLDWTSSLICSIAASVISQILFRTIYVYIFPFLLTHRKVTSNLILTCIGILSIEQFRHKFTSKITLLLLVINAILAYGGYMLNIYAKLFLILLIIFSACIMSWIFFKLFVKPVDINTFDNVHYQDSEDLPRTSLVRTIRDVLNNQR